jgi:membrane protease YdiL (CAAX protease family)
MKASTVLGKDEYVQQTKEYGRIDALFALIVYVVMIFLFLLMGKLFVYKSSTLTEVYIFVITGIFTLFLIGFVFLLCSIRKQNLMTVGFSMTYAIQSFGMGMFLFMIVIALKVITSVNNGSTIQTDIGLIVMKIIYYLIFIAFMEEVVIRGYIGTRLYGYFTNKRLSIVIVGIMFSLEHIPFQMMYAQMSLMEYISQNWGYLVYTAAFHFILQWLYAKYNSIIAPTIFHFIWNFIQWFIII